MKLATIMANFKAANFIANTMKMARIKVNLNLSVTTKATIVIARSKANP